MSDVMWAVESLGFSILGCAVMVCSPLILCALHLSRIARILEKRNGDQP